ncbi:hypothetical protein AB0J90_28540 [Micromonospora sp. NPDC049523]|uniref:hypothetical protein n=1 Tax=Micromonospora sp. NPDC049523 TaxID=3155921 RepID=UPI003423C28A
MTARPLVQVGDRVDIGSGAYLTGEPGRYFLREGSLTGTVTEVPNGDTPVSGNWVAVVVTDDRDGQSVPAIAQDRYLPGFVPRKSGLPDLADPR